MTYKTVYKTLIHAKAGSKEWLAAMEVWEHIIRRIEKSYAKDLARYKEDAKAFSE